MEITQAKIGPVDEERASMVGLLFLPGRERRVRADLGQRAVDLPLPFTPRIAPAPGAFGMSGASARR